MARSISIRRLTCAMLWLLSATAVAAQETPESLRSDYIAVAFHDVVDRREDLSSDAITTNELIRFFDWLKGNGWSTISIDDIEQAQSGGKQLPDNAILLTFDDGYESAYSRVYPLLLAYRYPAVLALTGAWMDGSAEGMVDYGTEPVPRAKFLTWDQVREMEKSGFVEIASHSFGLHMGILANPQGNLIPAAATWAYDPVSNSYENDASYRQRIRLDLAKAQQQIEAEIGKSPRVLVWPFGRRTGSAIEEAQALGFTHQLTLYEAPTNVGTPTEINRFYPIDNPRLADLARAIRFEAPISETKRLACFSLAKASEAGTPERAERELDRIIDTAYGLGANIVVLDGTDVPPANPAGVDILSHAVWQIRSRVGAEVYLRLRPDAESSAAKRTPEFYADLLRRAKADGLALDASPDLLLAAADGATPPSTALSDAQLRRRSLDLTLLTPPGRASMEAYWSAASIEPELKLMLIAPTTTPVSRWPAPIADLLLLPADAPGKHDATMERLQQAGWLSPEQSGRVVISLPAGSPDLMGIAMRQAQVRGATAFGLCAASEPSQLTASEIAVLAPTFSSADYPRKP